MLLEQLATAIDCEGHIGINRMCHKGGRLQYSARIGLAMCHPAIPKALHERFAGAFNEQPNPKGNYTLYRWTLVGNKQTVAVLEELLPHLVVKKEQAENALAFLASFQPRHKWNRISLEDMADRAAYWLKAKALNRPAPATTERDAPVMGCDSLNLHESARGLSEAVTPLTPVA